MTQLLRSFTTMLGLVSRGELARALDEDMESVITTLEGMPDGIGKAKITIEVEFIAELGRMDIKANFKTKLPETRKFVKTPFWSIEGALSVQHPQQIDMFSGPRGVRGRENDDEMVG